MARRKSSRTRNSAFNIATGIGGQMLRILLNFAVRTVFIHILGKVYLGVNGLFSNTLTLLSLTELGFATAMNFKLYKPLEGTKQKEFVGILVDGDSNAVTIETGEGERMVFPRKDIAVARLTIDF